MVVSALRRVIFLIFREARMIKQAQCEAFLVDPVDDHIFFDGIEAYDAILWFSRTSRVCRQACGLNTCTRAGRSPLAI